MPFGPVALFGSGETSRAGRQVHERLFQRLPQPVRVAILETPAGFQPNAGLVAAKIRDFLVEHLQNYHPVVRFVPARRRDGVYNPDAPLVVEPIDWADYLFAGPGSPTYMIRCLTGTQTLARLRERWAAGATLAFASAAAIAVGRYALPVYEIYKVGADLYWADGLDILGALGLRLAIMPHWNNREGGAELDTSHCFMGVERFRYLRCMLPSDTVILGIDEQTACILDPQSGQVTVHGLGQVTLLTQDSERTIPHGQAFPLAWLRADPVLP